MTTGRVILETNGSPVFVFSSSFPFYRDIGVGDQGPDVLAFQSGLVDLGLLGQADGVYGVQTAQAARELYQRVGYQPPTRTVASSAPTQQPTPEPSPTASNGQVTPSMLPYVPLSSLAAAQSLPATVRTSPNVGSVVSDSTVIIADSATADIRVSLSSTNDLPVGSAVTVTLEGGGITDGAVERLEESGSAGTDDSEQNAQLELAISAVIRPSDGNGVDISLVGRPATVTLESPPIAQDALLVPLSAVAIQDDGSGSMMVEDSDGRFSRVSVDVVASAGGRAAIASRDEQISVGQRVLLG